MCVTRSDHSPGAAGLTPLATAVDGGNSYAPQAVSLTVSGVTTGTLSAISPTSALLGKATLFNFTGVSDVPTSVLFFTLGSLCNGGASTYTVSPVQETNVMVTFPTSLPAGVYTICYGVQGPLGRLQQVPTLTLQAPAAVDDLTSISPFQPVVGVGVAFTVTLSGRAFHTMPSPWLAFAKSGECGVGSARYGEVAYTGFAVTSTINADAGNGPADGNLGLRLCLNGKCAFRRASSAK